MPENDRAANELDAVAKAIFDHFSNRWGQGAPVTQSEAAFLAEQIACLPQNRDQ